VANGEGVGGFGGGKWRRDLVDAHGGDVGGGIWWWYLVEAFGGST
jgi:hypothetical protein